MINLHLLWHLISASKFEIIIVSKDSPESVVPHTSAATG